MLQSAFFEGILQRVELMMAAAHDLSQRKREASMLSAVIEDKLEDVVDQFYLSAGPRSRVPAAEAQERLAVLDDLDYALDRTRRLRAAVVDQPADLCLSMAELGLLHEAVAKLRVRHCQGAEALDRRMQQCGENILQICAAEAGQEPDGASGGVLAEVYEIFGCLLEAVRGRRGPDGGSAADLSPPRDRVVQGSDGGRSPVGPAGTLGRLLGAERPAEVGETGDPGEAAGGGAEAGRDETADPLPWTVGAATSPLQVLDAMQDHSASCDLLSYLEETECRSLSGAARSNLCSRSWESEGHAPAAPQVGSQRAIPSSWSACRADGRPATCFAR